MKQRYFLLGLIPAFLVNLSVAAEKPVITSTNAHVIVYYFHGTTRCETCLKIEKAAREIIEQRFRTEITAKQLIFKPVNYDIKENAHFLADYRLPCPSLLLSRQKGGKEEKWKLLDKTWEHIETPGKFADYVAKEVESALKPGVDTSKTRQ